MANVRAIGVMTVRRAWGHTPARWVLIVSVLFGVFGMHVLGSHDMPAADSSMLATGQGSHAGSRAAALTVEPGMPAAMNGPHGAHHVAAITVPAGHRLLESAGPAGGMAHSSMGCILFLVGGAGLVLLALMLARHPDSRDGSARSGPLRDDRGRDPPAPGQPRFSLCVLRV